MGVALKLSNHLSKIRKIKRYRIINSPLGSVDSKPSTIRVRIVSMSMETERKLATINILMKIKYLKEVFNHCGLFFQFKTTKINFQKYLLDS